MDRTKTAVLRRGEDDDSGFVAGTPEERLALVWPLTREALSLSDRYDAEQRLQRHITRVSRREV